MPHKNIQASTVLMYSLTAVVAILVWVTPWVVLGGIEAWDHWSYFTISLPLMMAIAGWAAHSVKSRAWRWPLIMLLVQTGTSLILNGGPGNLFPLGVIVFVVLCIPIAIAAWFGAWLAGHHKIG